MGEKCRILYALHAGFLLVSITVIFTIQSRSGYVSLELRHGISKLRGGRAKILVSCIILVEANVDQNRTRTAAANNVYSSGGGKRTEKN
jgi:hypothetical protein